MQLIITAAAQMSEDHYRFFIVDSITALFRVDFSGRGELAERQQTFGQMMMTLTKLAGSSTSPSSSPTRSWHHPTPPKLIGGHILAHASTTRMYLRKGKRVERVAKVYDSLPEVAYELSTRGSPT
jgi:meiotic recombination protein DMC1